ncbi:MAG: Protein translocase subunit SecY [Phycisphaerae bacterium]|nr:Protein translocase subunit SecY [Phycisphaerae bacterium]
MLKTFLNIFKVSELRNKVLFTLLMLAIYRIGYAVPLPGVNQDKMAASLREARGGGDALGQAFEYFAIFTGGNLHQSTIFGLGIMPYISASIILQLLSSVVPALEKIKKEGATGQRKINEWTRYLTVPVCIIQAMFWIRYISGQDFVYADMTTSFVYWLMTITTLVSGTIFLMWLGEQIDEYGLGNGISLIIMAGILARMPLAIWSVIDRASLKVGGEAAVGSYGPEKLLFLVVAFVGVVAGSILITQGQRRIPIQQAKHMRGRRVYGGQRQYLPLRINHGGVMPIIFASSLLILPSFVFDWVYRNWNLGFFGSLGQSFRHGSYIWVLTYILMVYLFAYFWTSVMFQPKEMANNLRENGSFIPGLRPGKRTADYLEKVMVRITYVGAGFLALIAIIPTIIGAWLNIDFMVTQFLGGTGLLIVVSVALDIVNRIEANLIMRNYEGFLGGDTPIRGART